MKKYFLIMIMVILFPVVVFASRVQVDVQSSGVNSINNRNVAGGGYVCEDNTNPDYKIVYGNITNCSIEWAGEKLGEIVDFCGKKACAQKYASTILSSQSPIYNITCESGYSPVKRFGGQFIEDKYRQYNTITFCMNKLYVANTNLNYENVCGNESIMNIVRIIGHIINVIKWIIPFIIIVLGMVDFGKAITSDDEKATTKSLSTLVRRLIAGVVIFFVPTIVLAIINLFDISKGIEKENHASFGACTRCLLDPYRNECKKSK